MSSRTLRDIAAHAARRLSPNRVMAYKPSAPRTTVEHPAPLADTDTLAALLCELGHEVEVQRRAGAEPVCLISLDAGASRHIVEAKLSPGSNRLWLAARLGQALLPQTSSGLLAALLAENARLGPHFFGYRSRDHQLLLQAWVENRDVAPVRLRGLLDRLSNLILDTQPIWAPMVHPAFRALPPLAPGSAAPALQDNDTPQSWRLFASVEGRFRVQLPQTPRIEKQSLATEKGPLDLYVVSADQGGTGISYGVCYSDLEGPIAGTGKDVADAALGRAHEAVIQLMNGRVLEERPVTLEGHPGLELMIQSAEKGTAVARVVCVGDRVFQVLAVGAGVNPWQPPVRFFLDSFGLLRE